MKQIYTEGLSMFEDLTPRARTSDPETSHAAAKSMVEAAASQRFRLLAYLRKQGSHGATGAEIDFALEWRPCSANRRLKELEVAKLATRTTVTRPTLSGRAAEVWLSASCL